ncbi:MAG TPA: TIGR00269 family protein [Nitrososphaeraceae archaeon]|nr:TIGR00269 family protein [Nitrososphaeraceae archaeon]
MAKYSMLNYNDKVAVAVSGGKDSLSLLYILKKILDSRHRATDLIAITIDEGIGGYRDESLKIVQDFCSNIRIPNKVLSYKEIYGIDMDQAIKSRSAEKMTSCSICGTFRRRAMDLAAEAVGANVIATAHNLDDQIQSFMINILAGDVDRIGWTYPQPVLYGTNKLKKIKPFVELYEQEIVFYALQRDIPFQSEQCPYMHESIRADLRGFLNKFENSHPGIKYNIYNSTMKISKLLRLFTEKGSVRLCRTCGRECTSEICAACNTVTRLTTPRIGAKEEL